MKKKFRNIIFYVILLSFLYTYFKITYITDILIQVIIKVLIMLSKN